MTWGIFVNKQCKIPVAIGGTETDAWENLYRLHGGKGNDALSFDEFKLLCPDYVAYRIKIVILERPRRFTRNAAVGKYTTTNDTKLS